MFQVSDEAFGAFDAIHCIGDGRMQDLSVFSELERHLTEAGVIGFKIAPRLAELELVTARIDGHPAEVNRLVEA